LPQSYSDWDASEPNAYSDSNSYAHADIYTNGDSYAYADIYTDCDGNSYAYANGDSDSNVHRNRNCHSNGYRHRYSNCDGIAAAHTDAKTSSDTAAPTVRLAGCSLVWELASEPREFPDNPVLAAHSWGGKRRLSYSTALTVALQLSERERRSKQIDVIADRQVPQAPIGPRAFIRLGRFIIQSVLCCVTHRKCSTRAGRLS
jgi:hypothetical protein